MKSKNLKLIAKNYEDLRVVSAHLQDSIVSVIEIAHLKKNKIFLTIVDLFCCFNLREFKINSNLFSKSAWFAFKNFNIKIPYVEAYFLYPKPLLDHQGLLRLLQ